MVKKKIGNIIFALLLIVIFAGGIIRFLIMPYVKEKENENNEPDISVTVSESISDEANDFTDEDEPVIDSDEETKPEEQETDAEEEQEPVVELPEFTHYLEKVEGATLDDCDIVFIGDSVFTFGDEEMEDVPRVVQGFSEGIRVYNISKGGMAAGESTNDWLNLPEAVDHFIDITETDREECEIFNREINRYKHEDHEGRQLVIVLNSCINDYFMHTPLEGMPYDGDTYAGAWRNVYSRLYDEFPNAIIITYRTYTIFHGVYGYDFNKVGCTYNNYRDKIEEIAAEYININCLKLDGPDGINYDNAESCLEDGTHPNSEGAKIIATLTVNRIKELLSAQ